MAETLLTSEVFVKAATNISDNIAGKFILPSIREAQEAGLRSVIGDCLLNTLKALVADHTIDDPENVNYKNLLERSKYYLAYMTVVDLLPKVTWKVGNFGVVKSSDENLQVAPQAEVAKQQFYYQAKADGCCRDLQRWLLRNRSLFPELTDCDCAAMQANLRSSATCGVWLGGPRGRKLPGGGGCC